MSTENMNSRERVLAALHLEEPDMVPWIEDVVDFGLVQKLMPGKHPADVQTGSDCPEALQEKTISDFLGRDNICLNMNPPEFCDKILGADGILYYSEGHIRCEEDLEKMQLLDPNADSLYQTAETFVQPENLLAMSETFKQYRGQY